MTANAFIQDMLARTKLRQVSVKCRSNTSKRYTWGPVAPEAIALSIQSGSYLSHGTAVFLHALNDQVPKQIYVNKAQSPKPSPKGNMTQEGIDRAFRNKQRVSTYECTFDEGRCLLLSGKNTGDYGVVELKGANDETLRVTGLERTLVDIAVRPVYSGGVYEVLEAYRAAVTRPEFSSNVVLATLKKLDYRYPYHQAIGFYLERAGAKPSLLERFKRLGLNFDFYLDYAMPTTAYDSTWRLHFPKGL
jgi:predicted transcriptional regulator of viral defense system